MFDRVEAFVRQVRAVGSETELAEVIEDIARDLGFRYFALTHHTDVRKSVGAIRIHNYPEGWEQWFDDQGLGTCDPIHRASQMTSVSFAWSRVDELIALSGRDRLVLETARVSGIGDGITVPAHVPGETHGSCSFAVQTGQAIYEDRLPLAQLAGIFAFEAARHLRRVRHMPPGALKLTDRQRECVMWAARGKSDWEISKILGVSHETVIQHLKQARERYGVAKRTLLAVHALFDGSIGFADILRR